MKSQTLKTLVLCLASSLAGPLSAQTTWTGATDTALNKAGNWDNGVPDSAGNPGTIPAEAGAITHSFNLNGYFVTQNGGTLTSSVAFSPSNGSWTLNDGASLTPGVGTTLQNVDDGHQDLIMNGGTLGATQLNVSSAGTNRSASFTMSGGTATMTGRLDINLGGSVTINGGSLTAAANRMNDVSTTLTINGGVIALGTEFGRSGSIFMNGGSTTADSLSTYAGFSMTFGGTTAGSLTVDALGGSFMPPNRNFDWLTGSQMSFTVVNDDDWAETEWNAGRLKYNGNNKTDLADLSWAEALTDLGDGSYFVFDSGTYTLSLSSGGGDPTPGPVAVDSFVHVSGTTWQISISGDASADYIFKSAHDLDFDNSTLIENLAPGVPAAGTIGGTNNSVVTTDGGGQATVRMTLTGDPNDFVRGESAP